VTEGLGPMKSGNRYLIHGATSYRDIALEDEVEDEIITSLLMERFLIF